MSSPASTLLCHVVFWKCLNMYPPRPFVVGLSLSVSTSQFRRHGLFSTFQWPCFAMFSNVSPSGQKKANYHHKGTKKNVCFPSFLFIIFSFPLIFHAFSLDVGQNQFGFHSDLISIYYTLNPVRVFAASSTSWRFNLKIWMYSKCALVIIHFKTLNTVSKNRQKPNNDWGFLTVVPPFTFISGAPRAPC